MGQSTFCWSDSEILTESSFVADLEAPMSTLSRSPLSECFAPAWPVGDVFFPADVVAIGVEFLIGKDQVSVDEILMDFALTLFPTVEYECFQVFCKPSRAEVRQG